MMSTNAAFAALLSFILFSLCSLCASIRLVDDPDVQRLKQNGPNIQDGLLLGCGCSPSVRGFSRDAMMRTKKIVAKSQKNGLEDGGVVALTDCAQVNGMESCINADRVLRAIYKRPFCVYDINSGKNVFLLFPNSSDIGTVGNCYLHNQTRSPSKKVTERLLAEPNLNEGCVATEHLEGYVLQHKPHLMRRVLCAKGFCATPNHGIEVHGKLTSMKEMCGNGVWTCVESVKLVNNLKISANRRAKINDEITVTPYDVRFPKAVIWIAQMLEDVLRLGFVSACTGAIASIVFLVFSFADK